MKTKLKLIEGIVLSIVILFDIIMINHSYEIADYKENKDNRSTANYMKVEEKETKEEEKKEEEILLAKEEEKKEEQPQVVQDPIVYDGKTMNQLAEQLNKSLNSGNTISERKKRSYWEIQFNMLIIY